MTKDSSETEFWIGICESLDKAKGYHCVLCEKWLPEVDGVIVHDNVPHPPEMTFDEEDRPQ